VPSRRREPKRLPYPKQKAHGQESTDCGYQLERERGSFEKLIKNIPISVIHSAPVARVSGVPRISRIAGIPNVPQVAQMLVDHHVFVEFANVLASQFVNMRPV